MKLYHLYRLDEDKESVDEAHAFIVRARSPKRARQIAQDNAGDEINFLEDFWLDKTNVSCEELKIEGKERLILRDFNAG